MDELARFKKKAASYRQALKDDPTARILELYPIIWYLEKYRRAIGKRRKNIKIVDLMAGSGFLSENLSKLGYNDIHAIEFCLEMCQNSSVYASKARLHNISSFDHLEGILDQIKPDVIISLASFHHLLCYDQNDQVDKTASINLQTDVVDICMRALSEHGILLIADLIDEGVTETAYEPFRTSMKPISKDLHTLGIPSEITDMLSKCHSLHGATSILHQEFSRSGNSSLKWFRTVIDKKTSLGHKDIAISSELINKVSSYRPIITKYACPWIFSSRQRLLDFVYNKFAFGIHGENEQEISKHEVERLVESELGIRESNNITSLGWNLGIVLLGKLEPFSYDRQESTHVLYLSLMAALLIIAMSLRYFLGIYVELDVNDLFLFFLTLPLGAMLGDWVASSKGKK